MHWRQFFVCRLVPDSLCARSWFFLSFWVGESLKTAARLAGKEVNPIDLPFRNAVPPCPRPAIPVHSSSSTTASSPNYLLSRLYCVPIHCQRYMDGYWIGLIGPELDFAIRKHPARKCTVVDQIRIQESLLGWENESLFKSKYHSFFITLMVSSVTLKKELFDALALNLYPM